MNTKILCFIFSFVFFGPSVLYALNVEKLSDKEARIVDSFLERLTPLIEEKKKKNNANLLTFDELYAPLDRKEKKLLKKIQGLKPKQLGVRTPRQKEEKNAKPFKEITGQKIRLDGKRTSLPPQAVSPEAHDAYEKMMLAMEKDLGKRL